MNITDQSVIEVKKLNHRGGEHIGLWFDYNHSYIQAIKSLPHRKYSVTHKCWYIPYNEESWQAFVHLNLPLHINKDVCGTRRTAEKSDIATISRSESSVSPPSVYENDSGNRTADLRPKYKGLKSITSQGGYFIIKMLRNEVEIKFLKSLKAAHWNPKEKVWLCGLTMNNLKRLHDRYQYWTYAQFSQLEDIIRISYGQARVYITQEVVGESIVSIRLSKARAALDLIKLIPKRTYDGDRKVWICELENRQLEQLKLDLLKLGIEVHDRRPRSTYKDLNATRDWSKRTKFLLSKVPERHLTLMRSYILAMTQERKSWNTIQLYTSAILRYVTHHEGRHPDELTNEDIEDYLRDLSNSDISYATLNKHHSALKYYYKYLSNVEVQWQKIPRPQRPKSLPKILSKGEVRRLLAQVTNEKHLAMLYLAYGSGLRSGEIVTLRKEDLDWERQKIWIRHGKGNKDRLVTFPISLQRILKVYLDQHKSHAPWLFGGQEKGTHISATSLARVFKRCLLKAGLSQRYKLHSLRHSYATHLLDAGTDVRLIKELLGHSDIKTTLIYTHISDKTLSEIISPLDRLEMDKVDKNRGFV